MNPIDTTVAAQTDAIAFEFDLPHAPAKVWRAITVPTLVSEWLLPVTGLTLEPGSAFSFRTDPHPPWDGVVHCRMREIDPERKLSYEWVVGGMIDTVVTLTLTASATGTRMVLVQSGFKPEQKQNFGGARYGWRMMGGRLVALLARTA